MFSSVKVSLLLSPWFMFDNLQSSTLVRKRLDLTFVDYTVVSI